MNKITIEDVKDAFVKAKPVDTNTGKEVNVGIATYDNAIVLFDLDYDNGVVFDEYGDLASPPLMTLYKIGSMANHGIQITSAVADAISLTFKYIEQEEAGYTFSVGFSGYVRGEVTVKAKDEDEAIDIASAMMSDAGVVRNDLDYEVEQVEEDNQ